MAQTKKITDNFTFLYFKKKFMICNLCPASALERGLAAPLFFTIMKNNAEACLYFYKIIMIVSNGAKPRIQ